MDFKLCVYIGWHKSVEVKEFIFSICWIMRSFSVSRNCVDNELPFLKADISNNIIYA